MPKDTYKKSVFFCGEEKKYHLLRRGDSIREFDQPSPQIGTRLSIGRPKGRCLGLSQRHCAYEGGPLTA
jgi:hypothetical protein